MIATQDPNPLHTGRYFRLLIRALHYTVSFSDAKKSELVSPISWHLVLLMFQGSLLSPAEKKAYLRPVLTKVFKTDMVCLSVM